ncbi:MAG: class I SAM-dependent methyltransferase [Kiloniellaceae bacterium]
MLFRRLLKYTIRDGALRVIEARGRAYSVGEGEPSCTLRLNEKALDYKLALNPALYMAEAYMDGSLTVEQGTLREAMELMARNFERLQRSPLAAFIPRQLYPGRWRKQYNPVGKAQRNVAHHYDLSDRLYDLFLDQDRQYSCAYFATPEDDLDTAQQNKKRHIAAKLLLDRPDLKVLDIGSGWGGLGLYLAQAGDCDVTGVTLSREQHKISQHRAAAARLAERCRFVLKDYREETGTYDRIVSVGMFEHVGRRNYDEFFLKVRDLLADDGVCLLHSIGRFDQAAPINPFIRKYIFPGADLPALSEVMASVERAGLYATDIEILRLHYAETLRRWSERFQANRDRVAALYDARFCRMWELYLLICEMGFRYRNLMVFQLQLSKRLETLPLTRDYMTDWERAHGSQAVGPDQRIRAAR